MLKHMERWTLSSVYLRSHFACKLPEADQNGVDAISESMHLRQHSTAEAFLFKQKHFGLRCNCNIYAIIEAKPSADVVTCKAAQIRYAGSVCIFSVFFWTDCLIDEKWGWQFMMITCLRKRDKSDFPWQWSDKAWWDVQDHGEYCKGLCFSNLIQLVRGVLVKNNWQGKYDQTS